MIPKRDFEILHVCLKALSLITWNTGNLFIRSFFLITSSWWIGIVWVFFPFLLWGSKVIKVRMLLYDCCWVVVSDINKTFCEQQKGSLSTTFSPENKSFNGTLTDDTQQNTLVMPLQNANLQWLKKLGICCFASWILWNCYSATKSHPESNEAFMNFATHSTLFSKLLCRVPHAVRKVRTDLLNILFIFLMRVFGAKLFKKLPPTKASPIYTKIYWHKLS